MLDKIFFWGGFLLIVLYIGHLIYQKEQVVKHGTEFFLKLAPRDPRSMMQGDYMSLDYTVTRQLQRQKTTKRQGTIKVYLNKQNVASLTASKGANKTLLLQYKNRRGRTQIGPNAFFIQEGNDKYYNDAKYGIFRADNNGHVVLMALADTKRKKIIPPPKH